MSNHSKNLRKCAFPKPLFYQFLISTNFQSELFYSHIVVSSMLFLYCLAKLISIYVNVHIILSNKKTEKIVVIRNK